MIKIFLTNESMKSELIELWETQLKKEWCLVMWRQVWMVVL